MYPNDVLIMCPDGASGTICDVKIIVVDWKLAANVSSILLICVS